MGKREDELLEEIEADEPSQKALDALDKAFQAFTYTASLLTALSELLREEGDNDGALLLLGAAGEMAAHESRTL